MRAVTFDTLQAVETLKARGFTEEQARGVTEVLIKTSEEGLATKHDVKELELSIRAELTLLKWMLGFVLAGVMSIVIKLFIR
jgi:hypothetical protein